MRNIELTGKTVCVLGADGYIGWPLCSYLKNLGADVIAIDSCVKREWELRVDARPLARIPPFKERFAGVHIDAFKVDVTTRGIYDLLTETAPDVIVHLAEQPSAPMSMLSRYWATETQRNNVIGTLNVMFAAAHMATYNGKAPPHILKLGSMGEYGTPPVQINEGWMEVGGYRFPFPKQPGSIYHLSKVHDSANLEFACRAWGFRVTDVNQGIVWGTETWDNPFIVPHLRTAFHIDPVFGTVINRFLAQAAAKQPLTVYGTGKQTRGFIHLFDTLVAMALAIRTPPAEGEFRVINQITDVHSVRSLAAMISGIADVPINHIDNPRVESEDHKYDVVSNKLGELGFSVSQPLTTAPLCNMIRQLADLSCFKGESAKRRIAAQPDIEWRTGGLVPSHLRPEETEA